MSHVCSRIFNRTYGCPHHHFDRRERVANYEECANNSDRRPQVTRLRTSKYLRSGGLAAFVVAVSIALTACAAPSTPNVASVGTTTTATNGGSVTTSADPSCSPDACALTVCRISPTNPATKSSLLASDSGSAAPDSARPRRHVDTCSRSGEATTSSPRREAADAEQHAEALRCMRSHGVPNCPTPRSIPRDALIFLCPMYQDLSMTTGWPQVMASDGKCHRLLCRAERCRCGYRRRYRLRWIRTGRRSDEGDSEVRGGESSQYSYL